MGLIFGLDADEVKAALKNEPLPKFQLLLGVKEAAKGKRYTMFPPIFYPEGSGMNPKQLFLNPALAWVGNLQHEVTV